MDNDFRDQPNDSPRSGKSGKATPFVLLGGLIVIGLGIVVALSGAVSPRQESIKYGPDSIATRSPTVMPSTTGIANPPAAPSQPRIVGTPVTNNPTPAHQDK